MTFDEHLLALSDLRDFTDHKASLRDYSYVQLSGGRVVRSRTATVLLYPLYDDSHFQALHRLRDMDLLFAGIQHDRDLLESVDASASLTDTSSGDSVQSPLDIENLPSEVDSKFKKRHDHIVIKFPNAKTNTAVAKILQVSSNYVKMFSDKLLNERLLYLTHFTDPDKVQYSKNDLFGPLRLRYDSIVVDFRKRPSEILLDVLQRIRRTPLDQYIKSTNFFIELVRDGFDSVLVRYRPIIKDAIIEHNFYANFLKQEGIREFEIDSKHPPDFNPDGYLGKLDYQSK